MPADTTEYLSERADLGREVLLHQMRRSWHRGLIGAVAALPLLLGERWGTADLIFAVVTAAWVSMQSAFVARHWADYLRGYPSEDRWARGHELALGALLVGVVTALLVLSISAGSPRLVVAAELLGLTMWLVLIRWTGLRRPARPEQTLKEGAFDRTSGIPCSVPATTSSAEMGSEGGLALACSGGGIRAAAFCLGAIQQLMTAGWYDRTRRVYAVSGGSYIATGIHVARRHSRDASGGVPADLFLPQSPEADWLRRKSSFLLPTRSAWSRGMLTVLYGLLVNLAMIAALCWLGAQWIAWFIGRTQGACDGGGGGSCWRSARVTWMTDAGVVRLALGLFGLGILWLVGAKAWSKYTRGRTPTLAVVTTLLGAAGAVLVIGILLPWSLAVVHNAATSNSPNTSIARLVTGLGAVAPEACDAALVEAFRTNAERALARSTDPTQAVTFHYGSCGREFTDDARLFGTKPGTLPGPGAGELCDTTLPATPAACLPGEDTRGPRLQLVSLLGALTALGGLVRGLFGQSESTETNRLGRVWAFVRTKVFPWAASLAVVAGVTHGLVLVTKHYLVHPERLDRWGCVLVVIGVFGAVRALSDATTSSLHPFYRERIGDTFLVHRTPDGRVEPVHGDDDLAVSATEPPSGPALSVLGVANVQDITYVPAQRGCVSFRFDTADCGGAADGRPAYIGVTGRGLPTLDGHRLPAPAYARAADPQSRDTTLAAACAASGAAFSPIVGRESGRTAPYRLLMTLANARLGVWLPNPYYTHIRRLPAFAAAVPPVDPAVPGPMRRALARAVDKPGPFRIYKEAFGGQTIYDSRIYVTDGGHFDNTGMVEALRDGPRVLVVLDASADAADSLEALADAMTTARMDLGLVITPSPEHDPARMRATTVDGVRQRPLAPFIHLLARHESDPDVVVCDILFVKNVLTRAPDLELEAYADTHPEFPRTTTTNQFYGEYDWEAYRQLGWANTGALLEAVDRAALDGLIGA